jgi:hypothetical protein
LPLRSNRIPAAAKLSALWGSLMLCYVYGDYFGLYVPGKVMEMNAGVMGGLGRMSPAGLTIVAIMMAIPALMIALPLMVPPVVARWTSIVFGLVYTAIMALTMWGGAPLFYLTLGAIEIAISLTIVATAARWPRADGVAHVD